MEDYAEKEQLCHGQIYDAVGPVRHPAELLPLQVELELLRDNEARVQGLAVDGGEGEEQEIVDGRVLEVLRGLRLYR